MIQLDIPTAMTPAEAQALNSLARDKHVLEIGALLGYSTMVLAEQAKSVISIDPHDGYPRHAPRPTLDQFLRNVRRYGFNDRVFPLVGYAQNVLPALNAKRDLSFIDTTGQYDTTMYCLEHAATTMITCHDFNRGGCDGATRAVLEFVKKYNKTLEVIDTLAIIK